MATHAQFNNPLLKLSTSNMRTSNGYSVLKIKRNLLQAQAQVCEILLGIQITGQMPVKIPIGILAMQYRISVL